MKKRTVLGILIVAVIAICFGYFRRYQYFKIGRGEGIELEFRTNRYTNETDVLDNHGWHVLQTPKEWSDLHWNRTHPISLDMSKAVPIPPDAEPAEK